MICSVAFSIESIRRPLSSDDGEVEEELGEATLWAGLVSPEREGRERSSEGERCPSTSSGVYATGSPILGPVFNSKTRILFFVNRPPAQKECFLHGTPRDYWTLNRG